MPTFEYAEYPVSREYFEAGEVTYNKCVAAIEGHSLSREIRNIYENIQSIRLEI